jgi:DNA-binding response OmpR family regulator
VIFLTAKTSEEDHIEGFKAGGDDYVNKPFNIEELVLHVRAVLKRTCPPITTIDFTRVRSQVDNGMTNRGGNPNVTLNLKGYRLNTSTFELTLPNDKKILLTPIQFDLTYNFMSHPGEVFSPTHLLSIIWDYPPNTGSQDLVRVHIKNLRLRIELDPAHPTFVETISGYGYTVKPD